MRLHKQLKPERQHRESILGGQPAWPCAGLQAFTIVEFIGILAVLAIFAALLVPKVVKQVDRAAWTKEINDMQALSNGLALQILRSNVIPNQVGWPNAVANWTTRPVSQILTNNRGYARLFFYDTGSWLNGNLPFAQGSAGTGSGVPYNARIVLVSTISRALTATSRGLTTTDFNGFWNVVPGAVPPYLKAQNWPGRGDDLVIQRFSVDPLFHHLILTTRDHSNVGSYSINSTNKVDVVAVPGNWAGTSSYWLDGSVVGLWSNGVLSDRFILSQDMSYTFEAGTWRKQPTGAGSDYSETAQAFAFQAARFAQEPLLPGHQGADTLGVVSSFYDFMHAYMLWANMCPHFSYTGNEQGDANYQILDVLGQPVSGGGGNNAIIAGASGGLIK